MLKIAYWIMNILPWIAETDKIGQHKCKGHVMIGWYHYYNLSCPAHKHWYEIHPATTNNQAHDDYVTKLTQQRILHLGSSETSMTLSFNTIASRTAINLISSTFHRVENQCPDCYIVSFCCLLLLPPLIMLYAEWTVMS